jgi:alpha-glucosidase
VQVRTLTPFAQPPEIGYVDQYVWSWASRSRTSRAPRSNCATAYRHTSAAFLRAAETGAPVPPVALRLLCDATVRDLDDQYLLGPDLLVAPVISAGVTARHVYLPAGGWYDWHTDQAHSGSTFLLAETPLDRIPIFARAGAVIPTWPEAPSSTEASTQTWSGVTCSPAHGRGHVALIPAGGRRTDLRGHGARYRTAFEVTRTGATGSRLRADVEGDGYPEFARQAFHLVVHGAPTSVNVEDGPVRGQNRRFVLPNTGDGFASSSTPTTPLRSPQRATVRPGRRRVRRVPKSENPTECLHVRVPDPGAAWRVCFDAGSVSPAHSLTKEGRSPDCALRRPRPYGGAGVSPTFPVHWSLPTARPMRSVMAVGGQGDR